MKAKTRIGLSGILGIGGAEVSFCRNGVIFTNKNQGLEKRV